MFYLLRPSCDNCRFYTWIVPDQNRKFSPHYRHRVEYFWPQDHREALCAMLNTAYHVTLETTSTADRLLSPSVWVLCNHFDNWNAMPVALNYLIMLHYLHLHLQTKKLSRIKLEKCWKFRLVSNEWKTYRPAVIVLCCVKVMSLPYLNCPFRRGNSHRRLYSEYTLNSPPIVDQPHRVCCYC